MFMYLIEVIHYFCCNGKPLVLSFRRFISKQYSLSQLPVIDPYI
jgi:hypothetical protein